MLKSPSKLNLLFDFTMKKAIIIISVILLFILCLCISIYIGLDISVGRQNNAEAKLVNENLLIPLCENKDSINKNNYQNYFNTNSSDYKLDKYGELDDQVKRDIDLIFPVFVTCQDFKNNSFKLTKTSNPSKHYEGNEYIQYSPRKGYSVNVFYIENENGFFIDHVGGDYRYSI